jgi:cation transporter-like permease
MGRFVESDRQTAVVFAVSVALICLPSSLYGPSPLEQLLGMSLGVGVEFAVMGSGFALMGVFYVYRQIPSDPDDREWIPEE